MVSSIRPAGTPELEAAAEALRARAAEAGASAANAAPTARMVMLRCDMERVSFRCVGEGGGSRLTMTDRRALLQHTKVAPHATLARQRTVGPCAARARRSDGTGVALLRSPDSRSAWRAGRAVPFHRCIGTVPIRPPIGPPCDGARRAPPPPAGSADAGGRARDPVRGRVGRGRSETGSAARTHAGAAGRANARAPR